MAKFFIEVDDDLYYEFNAPSAAYPSTVATALGVFTSVPSGASSTTAGTFADWGILRVSIVLTNGERRIRLCDVDNFSGATSSLPSVSAFGGTIARVSPVRKRVLL